jgi:hypothetical protein
MMDSNFMIGDQEEDKQSIKQSIEGTARETWVAFGIVWGVTIILVLYTLLNG